LAGRLGWQTWPADLAGRLGWQPGRLGRTNLLKLKMAKRLKTNIVSFKKNRLKTRVALLELLDLKAISP
jgi:hypothetical protein